MAPRSVGILGAGTMGAGIAQVGATHGWSVLLGDVNDDLSRRAIDSIAKQLDRLIEKQKLTREKRDETMSRLRFAASADALSDCELIIEAIVEDFDAKVHLLKPLAGSLRDPGSILATNTSSLSISRLASAIGLPERTIGMHFFNPAPVLQLVEVIPGEGTLPGVVDRAMEIAREWGKTPVRAKDTPGFIVNRVARPYYLEAFRILEDGIAPPEVVDRAMRELGGFRMGPLELTDLIGQDVNTATTRSVWEQLGRPARLAPSKLQESLVAQGHLGRKSRQGVYRYDSEPPAPALRPTGRTPYVEASTRAAVEEFALACGLGRAGLVEQYVFARILVAVINECDWAVHDGVAFPADIDTALKLATSYPRGPLEWAAAIGRDACANLLNALNGSTDDGRFAPPAQA